MERAKLDLSLFPSNSPVSHEHPRDRRRAARQTFVAKASLAPAAFPAMARGIQTRDISMLGLKFAAQQPLNPGETFQIKLEAGPLKWRSRVRVVTCQQKAFNEFLIGAEFVGNELDMGLRQAA